MLISDKYINEQEEIRSAKALYWLNIWASHPSSQKKCEIIGHVEAPSFYAGGGINCFDDIGEDVDSLITSTIDGIVFNDLIEPCKNAILVRFGMCKNVFIFYRITYEEALFQAMQEIYRLGIKKNLA